MYNYLHSPATPLASSDDPSLPCTYHHTKASHPLPPPNPIFACLCRLTPLSPACIKHNVCLGTYHTIPKALFGAIRLDPIYDGTTAVPVAILLIQLTQVSSNPLGTSYISLVLLHSLYRYRIYKVLTHIYIYIYIHIYMYVGGVHGP